MYSRLFLALGFFVLVLAPSSVLAQSASSYRVDLIVEADTAVPPFYQGKALPTNGSEVTVTALPSFKGLVSPNNYRYVWSVNGKKQNSGLAVANNSFAFTPTLQNEVIVGVTVTSANGTKLAEASEVITLVDPEVHFYEKNPLRGLIPKTLLSPYTITGTESTLRAEAYFMKKDIARENLQTQWAVNGNDVASQGDPYEFFITKDLIRENTTLSFSILNLQDLLQSAHNRITVRF